MGGDDRVLDDYIIKEESGKTGTPDGWKEGDPRGYGATQADGVKGGRTAHGSFLNDVWYSNPTTGSQNGWNVVPDGEVGAVDSSEVIQSQMSWRQSNPGRVNPATWPVTDPRYCKDKCTPTDPVYGHVAGVPITYKDWIMCQDVFADSLEDPSICELAPECEDKAITNQIKDFYMKKDNFGWPMDPEDETQTIPLCRPQALWKKDNMWSPRRGHTAIVAGVMTPGRREEAKLYVMGGRAREYMRIDDDRMVGGVMGPRVRTEMDRITTREETVLKNDIWVSDDGLGISWKLINPGCESPQQDVLLQTEEWSGYNAAHKNVGQAKEKCVSNDDCYGVAECRQLADGSPESVCVCPMWSPRENHAVTVQHTYKVTPEDAENGIDRSLDVSEDYIYVVGGFINVRKSFCGSNSCGTNGYRFYMDDAWVSNNGGATWVQFKPAFDSTATGFVGRGAHAVALISHPLVKSNPLGDKFDQLWVFGGESGTDDGSTSYMNDVWRVELPTQPCCIQNGNCEIDHPLEIGDVGTCLPGRYDWKNATLNADWSGRSGHNVVVEPPGGTNNNIQRVVLIGGNDGTGIMDDVWTWGFENSKDPADNQEYDNLYYECPAEGEYTCRWERDYEPGQWYRINTGNQGSKEVYYGPGHGTPLDDKYMPTTPQQYYFYSRTDISRLGLRVFLPEPIKEYQMAPTDPGMFPELSDDDVAQIRSVGINTLDDLLNAETTQILNLRGFDFPQVAERLTVGDKICDILSLARAIEEKCTVRQIQMYDMEHQLPKNVEPVFGDPSKVLENAHFQWVGGGGQSNSHGKVYGIQEEAAEDDEIDLDAWDGCSELLAEDDAGAMAPMMEVDYPGYGAVTVPSGVRDPNNRYTNDMEEIKCRQNPGQRTMAAAEVFDQQVVVMGGKRDHYGNFLRDVWSRDDHMPTAFIKEGPTSAERPTEEEIYFIFDTDTAGASLFEYKVVDSEEKMDVIPWTLTTRTMGAQVLKLLDLDWPFYTGPGDSEYTFYLRAVDPAGNVGFQYMDGTGGNIYRYGKRAGVERSDDDRVLHSSTTNSLPSLIAGGNSYPPNRGSGSSQGYVSASSC